MVGSHVVNGECQSRYWVSHVQELGSAVSDYSAGSKSRPNAGDYPSALHEKQDNSSQHKQLASLNRNRNRESPSVFARENRNFSFRTRTLRKALSEESQKFRKVFVKAERRIEDKQPGAVKRRVIPLDPR